MDDGLIHLCLAPWVATVLDTILTGLASSPKITESDRRVIEHVRDTIRKARDRRND